jgi:hypothetical protein
MQAKLQEQLSSADAKVILGRLPERIQAALIARAAEIEYPIEAVIEMAIAQALLQADRQFPRHRGIRLCRL